MNVLMDEVQEMGLNTASVLAYIREQVVNGKVFLIVKDVSKTFGMTPNTMRKNLRKLQELGYLESIKGNKKGVRFKFHELNKSVKKGAKNEPIEEEIIEPLVEDANIDASEEMDAIQDYPPPIVDEDDPLIKQMMEQQQRTWFNATQQQSSPFDKKEEPPKPPQQFNPMDVDKSSVKLSDEQELQYNGVLRQFNITAFKTEMMDISFSIDRNHAPWKEVRGNLDTIRKLIADGYRIKDIDEI